MTHLQFEGKPFPVSADGFVPLTAFAAEIFDLSALDLRSFFDPKDRFYHKHEDVRQGLRHNVRYTTSGTNDDGVVVCEGGFFREDFADFIRRTRLAIQAENQAFDQILQEWRERSKHEAAPSRTRRWKTLLAKVLRTLAILLKRLAGSSR